MTTQIIFTTCANKTEAKRISEILISENLVACVNIFAEVESNYIWEGKSEWTQEVPMLLKTLPEKLESVRERLRALHSYTTPNMSAWLADSNADFEAWVRASVT